MDVQPGYVIPASGWAYNILPPDFADETLREMALDFSLYYCAAVEDLKQVQVPPESVAFDDGLPQSEA